MDKWIKMNKIHSGILAIVMSIFLIQATDPPSDKSTGSFLAQAPSPLRRLTVPNAVEIKHLAFESLANRRVQTFVPTQIPVKVEAPGTTISPIVTKTNTTDFEKKENSSITFESVKPSRLDEFLFDPPENQTLDSQLFDVLVDTNPIIEDNTQKNLLRRDDLISGINDNEHIGEILPNDYNKGTHVNQAPNHAYNPRQSVQPAARQQRTQRQNWPRRNFDESFRQNQFNPSVNSQNSNNNHNRKRFRQDYNEQGPEFELSGFEDPTNYRQFDYEPQASENFAQPIRVQPNRFLASEAGPASYRIPRRQRGYREMFFQSPIYREPFFESHFPSWEGQVGNRRPRVIFPTDLVAFRDTANLVPNPSGLSGPSGPSGVDKEPDLLSGDGNLQDIQQQSDNRERGQFFTRKVFSGGN